MVFPIVLCVWYYLKLSFGLRFLGSPWWYTLGQKSTRGPFTGPWGKGVWSWLLRASLGCGHSLQGPSEAKRPSRWACAPPLGSVSAGSGLLHLSPLTLQCYENTAPFQVWIITYLRSKSDFEFSVYLSGFFLSFFFFFFFFTVIPYVILVLGCFYEI